MNSLANKIGYENIAIVIGDFYSKARNDSRIGHFFDHIEDFSQHEIKITAFWWLALGGAPDHLDRMPEIDMPGAHAELGIAEDDLARWLNLFEQTLFDNLDMKLAGEWQLQVHHIANRLKEIVIQKKPMGLDIKE